MYLHLGKDVVVPEESVLAVCDLDNASWAYKTREFLSRAEQEGRIVNVSDDLPKSFVLCAEGETATVYLSQLSSSTLLRRSESPMLE